MVPALSQADNELLDLLREHQILDARQIAQVLAAREQAWQRQAQQLEGCFCTLANGQLRLSDYGTGAEKACFSLETGYPSVAEPLLVWVDPATGEELGRTAVDPAETGLLVTASGSLILSRDPAAMAFLGRGSSLPLLPGHDLIASPDGNYLLVSERQGGRLQVFSLRDPARLASLEIRELGSHKAIPACFTAADVIWLSDPESGRLGRLEIPEPGGEWEIVWQQPGLGPLGQLVPGPDGQTVYVLGLEPLRLISFDTTTMRVRQESSLAGMATSLGPRIPIDSLLLLPQSERLQMVYLTRQGKQTRLTVQQLSLRLSLAGELRALAPTQGWPWLVVAEENPLRRWSERELATWIVELGFLSAEYLVYLRQEARSGNLGAEEATPYIVPCGDEAPFDVLLRAAPELDFAPGAAEVILELLLQGTQQQGIKPVSPALQARLEQEAAAVLDFLREHYV
ncbi:MAG TPA: hypothetical protein V6D23_16800, partial [Candidatus Obscuribacterales bacterium]